MIVWVRSCQRHSRASVGSAALTLLDSSRHLTIAFEASDGAKIVDDDIQTQLNDASSEQQIIDLLTLYLQKAFEEQWTVVKSENFKWIKVYNRYRHLKPDLFITDLAFVARREPSNGTDTCMFGVPADSTLTDSLYILEGKTSITACSLGAFLIDMACLEFERKSTIPLRGMLFDNWQFWLLEVFHGVIIQRIICKWTTGGTVGLVRDFFPELPWVRALRSVQSELQLKLDPNVTKPFLGGGAYGRVFRMEHGVALKVVLLDNMASTGQNIYLEFIRLMSAREKCPELWIAPTSSSVCTTDDGAGYAMKPVGSPVDLSKGVSTINDVFDLLSKLHNKGVIHGDARLPNIIRAPTEELLLVDPLSLCVGYLTAGSRAIDMRTLARSVLGLSQHSPLPGVIETSIVEYSSEPTPRNARVVARYVSMVVVRETVHPPATKYQKQ